MGAVERQVMNVHRSEELEYHHPSIEIGVFYPSNVLTNQEIEDWNVTTPNGRAITGKYLSDKLGIDRRFIATHHQTTEYMGWQVAEKTVKFPGKVDVILASSSYPTGCHISTRIAEELGIGGIQTKDFHTACSGFVYMLDYLHRNHEEYDGANILLVSTEKYSSTVEDLRDQGNTDTSLAQTIFSDGAVATQFTLGKDLKILASKSEHLPTTVEHPEIQMPVDEDLMVMPYESVYVARSPKFRQEGPKVVRAVAEHVPRMINHVVHLADTAVSGGYKNHSCVSASDIKLVIPHQGSRPILQKVEEGLVTNWDPRYKGKVFADTQDGNWSSASVPKALHRAINDQQIQKGDRLVLAGFGAGMFASVAVVELQ